MSSLHLRGNYNLYQLLANKLAVVDSPEVRQEISQVLAEMCDPYVPYDTGALANTVQAGPDGVTYTQPYARQQYFGEEINHKTEYHPLATARWVEVMMSEHGEEFFARVSEIITRALKRGGE